MSWNSTTVPMGPSEPAAPQMSDTPIDFDAIRHAADVPPAIRMLYGTDLPIDAGIIHPTAVWQASGDRYLTLKLNSETPRSRYDRFVLNLARARADTLLTTGKILREEPQLSTGLLGDGPECDALLAWRRDMLGRHHPPTVLVLTSGQGARVDLDHPAFRGWAAPILFTGHAAAEGLFAEALARSIEVVSHEAPSIHEAVAYLQGELDCRTVSVEAGPSTSLALYRPAVEVDELLLSVYHGAGVPDSVRGPAFLSPADVTAAFGLGSMPYQVDEAGGPWSFHRFAN